MPRQSDTHVRGNLVHPAPPRALRTASFHSAKQLHAQIALIALLPNRRSLRMQQVGGGLRKTSQITVRQRMKLCVGRSLFSDWYFYQFQRSAG